MRFLSPLRAELIDDRREDGRQLWKLYEPLIFNSACCGIIAVPTGFETDFASIPRLPFVYWVFSDYGHRAAVVHDYLYKKWQRNKDLTQEQRTAAKKKADDVFMEAMTCCGIEPWRRKAMYIAVRCFGGRALPVLPWASLPEIDPPTGG